MEEENLRPYIMYPYSYAFGRSTKTLRHETISQYLDKAAIEHPNKMAVISVHENIERTFSELNQESKRLAWSLVHRLNVQHGDVIATITANCYTSVVLQYACARVGAILSPINAYYTGPEVLKCLQKVRPVALFLPGIGSEQESFVHKFTRVIDEIFDEIPSSLKHIVYLDGKIHQISNPFLERTDCMFHLFSELMAFNNDNIQLLDQHVDPDDVGLLLFTSGTTGSSKAAALTHFNLGNNSFCFGDRLDFSPASNDVVCLPVPVFHAFGAILGVITLATNGVTIVIPGYRYDVPSVVETMINYDCTTFYGVPAMLIDIMNYMEDRQLTLKSLKKICTGATNIPYHVVDRFTRMVPSVRKVYSIYGTTETSPIITVSFPSDGLHDTLDNVGTPIDLIEVKITNPQTGETVKIGEHGELKTRGPHVFPGYWNDKIQTDKCICKSGWYNTGDLATMDKDGYIRIVGRTKEIIIRGGINIHPREIEEVLITHPQIELVAVCGVPHDRLGEELCAWIKLRDPNKPLDYHLISNFCKDKLAYFKIPRKVLFVRDIPMTKSGKVQKFKMSQLSPAMLAEQRSFLYEKTIH